MKKEAGTNDPQNVPPNHVRVKVPAIQVPFSHHTTVPKPVSPVVVPPGGRLETQARNPGTETGQGKQVETEQGKRIKRGKINVEPLMRPRTPDLKTHKKQ